MFVDSGEEDIYVGNTIIQLYPLGTGRGPLLLEQTGIIFSE